MEVPAKSTARSAFLQPSARASEGCSSALPWPVSSKIDSLIQRAGLPGSEMVPAGFDREAISVFWLGRKRLQLIFGSGAHGVQA